MPSLASRLFEDQFFSHYADAAGLLGKTYHMHPSILMPVLENQHGAWKNEILREAVFVDWEDEALWKYALASLTAALCARECITYEMFGPPPSSRSEHQELLSQYPSIYTALQFARYQHMSVYCVKNNLASAGKFFRLQERNLRKVMERIKRDYREAEDFVNLLKLPDIDFEK